MAELTSSKTRSHDAPHPGFGVGLRSVHVEPVLHQHPAVDFDYLAFGAKHAEQNFFNVEEVN